MWEIPWIVVQRMLIDAPSYKSPKGADKSSGDGDGPQKMDHHTLTAKLRALSNTLPR